MGFVTAKHAEFVHNGLRWGFEVGLHPDRLQGYRMGYRFFKNYESATGAFRSRVTEATESRVGAGRTLHLGEATTETLIGMSRSPGCRLCSLMNRQSTNATKFT